MENTHTLASMFEANKQALENKLISLSLPKDANQIQKVVTEYLNSLFENDGEYRQHLTQAENYIINDVVDLLNVQHEIINELVCKNHPTHTSVDFKKKDKKSNKGLYTLLGSGVGGSLGVVTGNCVGGSVGTIIGTWGAVFGAIAGAAIVIYCSTLTPSNNGKTVTVKREIPQTSIKTEVFLDIIKKICERVDRLIGTFRNQIKRVENAYKKEEKPSLMRDYPSLTDRLEELFQLAQSEENNNEELLSQIDLVQRSLKNYGVIYEDGKLKNK